MDTATTLLLVAILGVLLVIAVVVIAVVAILRAPTPTPETIPQTMTSLEHRLLEALETSHRSEVENLLAIIGVEPRPDVAAEHLEQLTAVIRDEARERAGAIPNPNPQPAMQPLRQPWAFPVSPDDLEPGQEWDDPTNLSLPLDQLPDLPDALAPEGEVPWGVEEPVAFPEPVPEGEHRQRIVGMAPGENPLADIGITPAWRDE